MLIMSGMGSWLNDTLVPLYHGLVNYIDTIAKCRHLKKLTCKGTLRQVFIRVYRPGSGDTVTR
jgi:hypothetical protein